MLKQLYIRNFTIIDELRISFNSGFSVITGETGAGKSIILGAIGLLLGHRADSKSIRTGTDKCIIEAHFLISDYDIQSFFSYNDIDYDADDCILRREISVSGKSRAFINDMPVSLSLMKELGEMLVDVHSQHQNLLLGKEDFQLNVVDIIADNAELINIYNKSFDDYTATVRQLEQLKASIVANKEKEEFLRFQYDEISNARLSEEEQENLEAESEIMSHSEEIKIALYEADVILTEDRNGILERMKSVAASLYSIEKVYPSISEIASRLESCHIELKDISQEIGTRKDSIEFEPYKLDEINSRLNTIYTLQQKYHVNTIKELLDICDGIKEQLDQIDNSDEEISLLEKEAGEKVALCKKLAAQLTLQRAKAAKIVEDEMHKRLIPLGIPNVKFTVMVEPRELTRKGADKVSFLFSANNSTPMLPVSQVASGGEIARVMLSLKAMISKAVSLPTIIFDEIDTGVSGKTAESMALIMKEMGNNERQVISITHLPQIAAMGKTQYKVFKEETPDGTISRMIMLDSDQRVNEIAQMLSGSDVTQAAISNAKELLSHN